MAERSHHRCLLYPRTLVADDIPNATGIEVTGFSDHADDVLQVTRWGSNCRAIAVPGYPPKCNPDRWCTRPSTRGR